VYCWAGDGAGMIPTGIIIAKIALKPTTVSTYLHVAPTASYSGMIPCDHGLLEEYATGGKEGCAPFRAIGGVGGQTLAVSVYILLDRIISRLLTRHKSCIHHAMVRLPRNKVSVIQKYILDLSR
jgi:hypothetical protein